MVKSHLEGGQATWKPGKAGKKLGNFQLKPWHVREFFIKTSEVGEFCMETRKFQCNVAIE